MGTKKIVTAVLLLFVTASVGWLVVKEVRGRAKSDGDRTGATPTPTISPESPEAARERVVVYYFHGTMRCRTCRAIEAYTREAVEAGFPEDLRNGRIEMRDVNVDEPENEHFVSDYELTTKSVVLVRTRAGREAGWENLSRVWELVSDESDFKSYIQEKVRGFLDGNG